ncbi:hypothetical protein LGT39_07440 [Demequina sp. TTPB684]|uniref:hypothetical protein n=1 Tax=unclassified Demequina TaxID=2620311 RepID=UPI001CF47B46|nr:MULTISPECIES: hypothetical protein [unclassified Demequina]MCB2412675.1 hypothetical protein [Demequina sp. TTPB684]UPU87958.1 hypothetical protein LGT36_012010 [Demequina sp. TMPB413]
MRTVHAISAVAASSLAVVLLAGCGGGDTEEGTEDGESITIAGLLGASTGEDTDWAAQEAQVQEAIAQCMQLEGWEYIPVEQPDGVYEYSEEDELERIKREGLGIAYYTLYQGTDDFVDPYQDWVDPNQEYMESLTEAEREAYYESLYGTEEEQMADSTTEVDPETGEEYTISYGYGAGCQGEAYAEVQGDDPTQSPDYWEAAEKYYTELQERTEADPRIIEANEKWTSCMSDAGFEYKDQNDFWETSYMDLQTRHDEILGDDFYKDPFEGWSEEEINTFFEESTQEEIDALFGGPPELTSEQRTALEALLEEEIGIAVANHECSIPQQETLGKVYAEIEEQYALEHEDELKALAATLAGEK